MVKEVGPHPDDPGGARRYRLPALLSLATALTLAGFAVCYWLERVTHSDAPLVLLNMVNHGGVYAFHARFVSMAYQWLPGLLTYVHLPLRAVAIGYSVAYALIPVWLMLGALLWLRRPFTAIALAIYITTLGNLLFFYPVSDLEVSVALLIFYDGLYRNAVSGRCRPLTFWVASAVLIPTMVFGHPMMVVVLAGWLALAWAQSGKLLPARAVWIVGALALAALLIKRLWFMSGYEQNTEQGFSFFKSYAPAVFHGRLATTFLDYLLKEGFIYLVLLGGALVLCVLARQWMAAVVLVVFTAAYATLVLVRFENGQEYYQHYYEHMARPLVGILALVLSAALERLRPSPRLVSAGLILTAAVFTSKLTTAAQPHRHRIAWMGQYLRKMEVLGLKKAVLGRQWIPEGLDKTWFWVSGFESTVVSSLDGPEHSRTLLMVWSLPAPAADLSRTDQMLVDNGFIPLAEMNPHYFRLGSAPYAILDSVMSADTLRKFQWVKASGE